jgi:ribonucleoside-diphosphate reductase beta chain
MSLFIKSKAYRPHQYPWAFTAWEHSEKMHWLPKEVPLTDDVVDWKTKLKPAEKHLLTHIFRFFTQADCDIAAGYIDHYMPMFKPNEIRMMLGSFVAREAVHIAAYSTLIDELGLPEVEYSMFMQYQAMKEKHDYMFTTDFSPPERLAVFSAFGEGLQLFSSFIILLNFNRFGKMRGMGQMIAWSIRDESHHVNSMIHLYHEMCREIGMAPEKQEQLYDIAREMVRLEDAFIDLAFEQGDMEGLTSAEVKAYIRFIANRRLVQLGLQPIYSPEQAVYLQWVDVLVNAKEHTNFFENRPTNYTKGAMTGTWDEAFT